MSAEIKTTVIGTYPIPQWLASARSDPHALRDALHCDHLLLEFARRGFDELESFKNRKPEISLGVGVIDIKDLEVEKPGQSFLSNQILFL